MPTLQRALRQTRLDPTEAIYWLLRLPLVRLCHCRYPCLPALQSRRVTRKVLVLHSFHVTAYCHDAIAF
uniref:Transposase n=1 Tax=Panagrellus redivivus TaxID=6233 RepID=A0A7E4UWB7_PANRE